jgi:hypothetical protein
MDQALDPEAGVEREMDATFGVLVGWTHSDFSGGLNLKLQTLRSSRLKEPDEPDSHHFIMSKNQAAVLANFLFQVSGQTPPVRHKRSLLKRVLG